MKRAAFALLAAIVAAPVALQAQDVKDFLGQWESTVETQQGPRTTTYSFWMDGDMDSSLDSDQRFTPNADVRWSQWATSESPR